MSVIYQRIVEEDLDLGRGTTAISAPAGGLLTGRRINRGTFYLFDVTKYGAVGDGTTDDTAAIQQAIDAAIAAATATAHAIVFFPAGTYRCTAALTALGANYVHFVGENRRTTRLVWDDTALAYGLLIDTRTADATTTTLTADTTLGSHTLTVADASAFTAGQWAWVQTDADLTQGSHLSYIVSASGTTLTLDDGVPCPLLTGATVRQYTHPLLEGVEVRGLTFACVAGRATASFVKPLFLSRIHDVLVDDCDFDGSAGPLVVTRVLRGGIIQNCHFRHALTIAGVGVELQGSTGVVVSTCSARFTRFGFVAAQSPRTQFLGLRHAGAFDTTQTGRSAKLQNSSNFSVIQGCVFSDIALTGIRLESTSYCTVTGNTVSFYARGQAGAGGIQCGGAAAQTIRNTITDNILVGGTATAGGIVLSYTDTPVASYHVLSGNTISACQDYGIYAQGTHNIIHNNNVGSAHASAILYVPATSGANSIDGNILTREGGATPNAIHTSDGTGANVIGALNTYADASLATLHATDTCISRETFVPNVGTSTQVGTGANTTETTAFTTTITGGVLATNYEGFRFTGRVTTGANANTKTLRVKAGTATVTFTLTDNDGTLFLDIGGFYSGGAVYLDGVLHRQLASGVAAQAIVRGTTSTDDWTTDQAFAVTLQNGTASADDLRLIRGLFTYSNVARRPVL